MEEKLQRLKTLLAESTDLARAAALLEWDQQVNMPEGGARARGEQLSTLQRLAHERFTSDEVGQLLEDLQPYAEQLDPDSTEARLLYVTGREYRKRTKVPASLVAEFTEVVSRAHQVWAQARANDDFAAFAPHLQRIVELRQQYANLFAPFDHVYDPLLDDFEPGVKTADVQAVFEQLRPQQVELIKAIGERPQVDDSFLYGKFAPQRQWDFGVEVLTKMGYDWKRGRQDKSAHPFTTSFGVGDVRITTRVDKGFLSPAFFATIHEGGHALYEQGVADELSRTPLQGGASLAFHESQSRMWENLVGRSRPFWEYFFPRLQEVFPAQFGNLSLDAFYKGINKVEPSLVRVEADEATYNLHIMLRLEIEIGLMDGSVQVKDLPEIWNTRMQEYLGVVPPNDAEGVLQDVHWSGGMIGYFPTYALGNVISAQLWEKIVEDIPDLDEQMRQGKFDALLDWTREKIHRHGAKYEPKDLLQRVTGSAMDPAPYMRYLKNKFGEIYGLS
ncbi:MAG TPA: carboxypeptidase M32 [Chloroflexi bacterium]|nr:carboxypeptidase M32 [Chloroflexota bacterium]